ncbi:MAG: ABC transporter ATP-binding protein [Rhodospirillaceae bacterium]|nr:ABC transporter ATP-binding protein [Rhodospirillaceae bacterium]MBL6942475.1 ABC transporter ATP-binding protein [Rhodospirillales bacterium]
MSMLRVENLNMSFGGVHAVENMSFSVIPGTIHSIIGPNGAGKTTLFNLITGVYSPSSGRVFFNDRDITNIPTFELAKYGISRTFQNLQIFFNMSAVENVMVGNHLKTDSRFLPALFGLSSIKRGERECRERAEQIMCDVGLEKFIGSDADSMPYGALKWLEIARALASEPAVLLLDEPAAGLNPSETSEIDDLIKRVAEKGITVILVEHDMKLVMGVSDHILVLDSGRKLAEGTAEEIRKNPDVIEAYLGHRRRAR